MAKRKKIKYNPGNREKKKQPTGRSHSSISLMLNTQSPTKPLHHRMVKYHEESNILYPSPSLCYIKKKKVCFSSKVRVSVCHSRQDLTEADRDAIWYSRDEYHHIQRSCLKQVKMIGSNERLRDRKYCARGLEGFSRVGLQQKRHSRGLSIQMTLAEQDRQFSLGILDEDAIASVYNQTSSSSRLWAIRQGLLDQKEASEILMDDAVAEEDSIRSSVDHETRSSRPSSFRSKKLKSGPAINFARAA